LNSKPKTFTKNIKNSLSHASLLHVTSAFVLVSASQLTTTLQPSIYGFTAVYLRLHSCLRLYSRYL